MTDRTTGQGLTVLGLKIATALTAEGQTVNVDTGQGLDGDTDLVTITTPDHTVTVTPRLAYHEWPDPTPSAFNTPPPTVGMTHPPM